MSDIRLHSLVPASNSRKARGYARLNNTDSDTPSSPLSPSGSSPSRGQRRDGMSPSTGSSNNPLSSRKPFWKGKRREEYDDGDAEEEATLLGGGEQDGAYPNEEQEHSTSDAASQVRLDLHFLVIYFVLIDCSGRRSRGRANLQRKINLGPFLFVRQVRHIPISSLNYSEYILQTASRNDTRQTLCGTKSTMSSHFSLSSSMSSSSSSSIFISFSSPSRSLYPL